MKIFINCLDLPNEKVQNLQFQKKIIIKKVFSTNRIMWSDMIEFRCQETSTQPKPPYLSIFLCTYREGAQCVELELEVAVLCAQQYMSWNIFPIQVLNNFCYFEHPTLTMIYSEAYLKRNWRYCLWKKWKGTLSDDDFSNIFTNMLLSKF